MWICLLCLVIAISYDISTSLGRNEYTEKYSYVTNHQDGIKTLIIGSSLAQNGFNPFVLGDSVYNFAQARRTLFYDVELMRQLLPTMPSIQTVIYSLHYNLHLVDTKACDTTNRLNQLVFPYYRYMNVDRTETPSQKIFRSAIISGYFNIKSCINTEPSLEKGYYREDTSFKDNRDFFTKSNPPLQPDTAECIRLLTELARICQQNKAKLIVYVPPFSDDYIAQMTDEGRANLQKIINSVKTKYPIEYKDYSNDTAFRDLTLYYEWSHLNHRGATLLAQRMQEDFNL